MHPILFSLGPLTLKTYGLAVALSFWTAYWIIQKHFQKNNVNAAIADRFLFLAIVAGLLGSRVLYLAANPDDWKEFFFVWRGGLSYFGGLLGAGGAILIYAVKKKIPLTILGDALALALPLAHAIGRLGCLAAGCCWGNPTKSKIAIIFTNPQCVLPQELLGIPLHPTQIYEALAEIFVFLLLFKFREKQKGLLLGFYLILYGALRFLIEFIRGTALIEPHFFGLTFTQGVILTLVIPLGLAWIFLKKSKSRLTQLKA